MTGTTTAGSPVVTNLSSSPAGLQGQVVTGSGIQAGTTVQLIFSSTEIILSQLVLTTAAGVALTFTPSTGDLQAVGYGTVNAVVANLTQTSPAKVTGFKAQFMIQAFWQKVNFTGNVDAAEFYKPVIFYSRCNAFLTLTNYGIAGAAQALTVRDVLKSILLCWGIQVPGETYEFQMREAIHYLNAALQDIWSFAKEEEYFSRQTLTLSFAAGQAAQQLPVSVLSLLGPVRLGNFQPLRPIASRSQFDGWNALYLGGNDYATQSGNPIAFFLERLNQPGPDNVNNILHITPTPNTNVNVLLDVSTEPPRYLYDDYRLNTPVSFPNRYCDSVLLPFCRKGAANSQYFTNPDRRASIESDYQNAMRIIGAVDPQQKEVAFAEHSTERGGK